MKSGGGWRGGEVVTDLKHGMQPILVKPGMETDVWRSGDTEATYGATVVTSGRTLGPAPQIEQCFDSTIFMAMSSPKRVELVFQQYAHG